MGTRGVDFYYYCPHCFKKAMTTLGGLNGVNPKTIIHCPCGDDITAFDLLNENEMISTKRTKLIDKICQ